MSARARWPAAILAVLLLLYLGVATHQLDRCPKIHDDESWIASAPHKLVTQGVYGSDLFSGFHGAENRNFFAPPVFYLLAAGDFEFFGTGLMQLRLLNVFLGLLTLLAAALLAKLVCGTRAAVVVVLLLLLMRLSYGRAGETGIPLLDLARIGRIDMPVTLFGLLALVSFHLSSRWDRERTLCLLSGALAGLSALTHLYGLCFLTGLLLAAVSTRADWKSGLVAAGWVALGATVVHLPWFAYVFANLDQAIAQQSIHALRFRWWDPSFYVSNLESEWIRYNLFRPEHPMTWTRIGTIVAGLSLTGLLIDGARKIDRIRTSPIAPVAIVLSVHLVVFALLLQSKSRFYVVSVWSCFIIVMVARASEVWQRTALVARGVLAILLGLIVWEGVQQIAWRSSVCDELTPYEEYTDRLKALIPPDALVLGFQHYWLGMTDRPYRSVMVPIYKAGYFLPDRTRTSTSPFGEALREIDPEVVIMDPKLKDVLARYGQSKGPDREIATSFSRFLKERNATTAGVVDDDTYGQTTVLAIHHGGE